MQNRKLYHLLFLLLITAAFLMVPNVTFAVSDDEFTEEELASFEELRRKGHSEKEIEEIKALTRAHKESSRELTDSEKKEIDQYLKSIWKQMCAALSKGDVEKALTFFNDRRKPQYQKIFESMSKKELKDLAKDLMANDMELDSFYGSNGVHYNLICGKYSYSIQFGKPFNDGWKILAF